MTLQQSWTMTLKIWIDRFGKAQEELRKSEREREVLATRLSIALDMLTEDQLAELMVRAGVAETQDPHVGEVSDAHGG